RGEGGEAGGRPVRLRRAPEPCRGPAGGLSGPPRARADPRRASAAGLERARAAPLGAARGGSRRQPRRRQAAAATAAELLPLGRPVRAVARRAACLLPPSAGDRGRG